MIVDLIYVDIRQLITIKYNLPSQYLNAIYKRTFHLILIKTPAIDFSLEYSLLYYYDPTSTMVFNKKQNI